MGNPLPEKKDFHHPYEPYEIQQQLMHAIYDCIEQGKVGIFESPTGTGKSLSLICSSLTWLREHKRQELDHALAAVDLAGDEPDWMLQHARETKRREMVQLRADFEARLQSARDQERKLRDRQGKQDGEPPRKRQKTRAASKLDDNADDEFMLDDYQSDDDGDQPFGKATTYSTETAKLLDQLGMSQTDLQSKLIVEDVEEVKIFFCSRTHSQLSQFVGELKRVKLPPSLPPETKTHSNDSSTELEERLRQVSLGSRKNLCINDKVLRLSNATAINERCLELQHTSKSADQRCQYLPQKDDPVATLDFRDHALSRIRDIEDLANLGSKMGVCPFYASRAAVTPAEMVTLPYPLLLQKSAREALGISLKGNVVVIDEAHNLINAIEGTYSASISEPQVKRVREALIVYLQRFRNRLKGSNRAYLAQLVRTLDSFLIFFNTLESQSLESGLLDPGLLLTGKNVDQINLAKLSRYIQDSKLARKVEGYIKSLSQQVADKHRQPSIADVPTLMHVQEFLATLMNPSAEGQFFWSRDDGVFVVRYMLLDPSEHFREIVEDARAVILAGGTMSPIQDYEQQLFPYLSSIVSFSCGHLIPPEQLLVRTIASDELGRLDMSYRARNKTTASRIGMIMLQAAAKVHGGFVVFLPSYSFLEEVVGSLNREGIMAKLSATKPVFCDSRNKPAEETFRWYADAIELNKEKGAILLSVIGGKLSEGINFSDDLGRCVLVVGLPFPNLETPEWKAKIKYINQKAEHRGETKGKAGREHAENVCMRAVNQAIGRVIRHQKDWASILLLDARYADERIQGKLPGWIKSSVVSNASLHVRDVVRHVGAFFDDRTQGQ